MTENPWIADAIRNETDLQDGDHELAERLVRMEYESTPEPARCKCGGSAHYKATIGCLKCTDCGRLYHTNGEEI